MLFVLLILFFYKLCFSPSGICDSGAYGQAPFLTDDDLFNFIKTSSETEFLISINSSAPENFSASCEKLFSRKEIRSVYLRGLHTELEDKIAFELPRYADVLNPICKFVTIDYLDVMFTPEKNINSLNNNKKLKNEEEINSSFINIINYDMGIEDEKTAMEDQNQFSHYLDQFKTNYQNKNGANHKYANEVFENALNCYKNHRNNSIYLKKNNKKKNHNKDDTPKNKSKERYVNKNEERFISKKDRKTTKLKRNINSNKYNFESVDQKDESNLYTDKIKRKIKETEEDDDYLYLVIDRCESFVMKFNALYDGQNEKYKVMLYVGSFSNFYSDITVFESIYIGSVLNIYLAIDSNCQTMKFRALPKKYRVLSNTASSKINKTIIKSQKIHSSKYNKVKIGQQNKESNTYNSQKEKMYRSNKEEKNTEDGDFVYFRDKKYYRLNRHRKNYKNIKDNKKQNGFKNDENVINEDILREDNRYGAVFIYYSDNENKPKPSIIYNYFEANMIYCFIDKISIIFTNFEPFVFNHFSFIGYFEMSGVTNSVYSTAMYSLYNTTIIFSPSEMKFDIQHITLYDCTLILNTDTSISSLLTSGKETSYINASVNVVISKLFRITSNCIFISNKQNQLITTEKFQVGNAEFAFRGDFNKLNFKVLDLCTEEYIEGETEEARGNISAPIIVLRHIFLGFYPIYIKDLTFYTKEASIIYGIILDDLTEVLIDIKPIIADTVHGDAIRYLLYFQFFERINYFNLILFSNLYMGSKIKLICSKSFINQDSAFKLSVKYADNFHPLLSEYGLYYVIADKDKMEYELNKDTPCIEAYISKPFFFSNLISCMTRNGCIDLCGENVLFFTEDEINDWRCHFGDSTNILTFLVKYDNPTVDISNLEHNKYSIEVYSNNKDRFNFFIGNGTQEVQFDHMIVDNTIIKFINFKPNVTISVKNLTLSHTCKEHFLNNPIIKNLEYLYFDYKEFDDCSFISQYNAKGKTFLTNITNVEQIEITDDGINLIAKYDDCDPEFEDCDELPECDPEQEDCGVMPPVECDPEYEDCEEFPTDECDPEFEDCEGMQTGKCENLNDSFKNQTCNPAYEECIPEVTKCTDENNFKKIQECMKHSSNAYLKTIMNKKTQNKVKKALNSKDIIRAKPKIRKESKITRIKGLNKNKQNEKINAQSKNNLIKRNNQPIFLNHSNKYLENKKYLLNIKPKFRPTPKLNYQNNQRNKLNNKNRKNINTKEKLYRTREMIVEFDHLDFKTYKNFALEWPKRNDNDFLSRERTFYISNNRTSREVNRSFQLTIYPLSNSTIILSGQINRDLFWVDDKHPVVNLVIDQSDHIPVRFHFTDDYIFYNLTLNSNIPNKNFFLEQNISVKGGANLTIQTGSNVSKIRLNGQLQMRGGTFISVPEYKVLVPFLNLTDGGLDLTEIKGAEIGKNIIMNPGSFLQITGSRFFETEIYYFFDAFLYPSKIYSNSTNLPNKLILDHFETMEELDDAKKWFILTENPIFCIDNYNNHSIDEISIEIKHKTFYIGKSKYDMYSKVGMYQNKKCILLAREQHPEIQSGAIIGIAISVVVFLVFCVFIGITCFIRERK